MPRPVDYDTLADSFDRRYEAQSYPGIERALLEFLGAAGGRVLEAGCGTGYWLEVAARRAERSAEVAGIDPARRMVARARERVPGAALALGRAEALPWRTEAFHRLFCVNAYHHFTRPLAFLVEAHRVLDPDGGLLIVGLDPHVETHRWWVYDFFEPAQALDRERYPAGQRLREALDAAGFCRIASFEADHIVAEVPARVALEQGWADRGRTSQLTMLTEEEYGLGMARLRAAMAEKEAAGEELVLTADLRFYATVGWMRARSK